MTFDADMPFEWSSRPRNGALRTAGKAVAMAPTLFKPDHARGIDRLIDYFGGISAPPTAIGRAWRSCRDSTGRSAFPDGRPGADSGPEGPR
jgi:hypothetical protein